MTSEFKQYSAKVHGKKASVGINWAPLDPRWAEGSLYGPVGRYVVLGWRDNPRTQFFRNPLAKPLLNNGGK